VNRSAQGAWGALTDALDDCVALLELGEQRVEGLLQGRRVGLGVEDVKAHALQLVLQGGRLQLLR